MSKILINCNLQSGDWTIQEEDLQSHYTDLFFYFSGSEPLVMFNNLTFGVKVRKNTEEIFSETYGTTKKFVACENTLFDNWIESGRVYVDGNTTYTIELWCENDGIMRTYQYDYLTPV